jgi:hypothetical protein
MKLALTLAIGLVASPALAGAGSRVVESHGSAVACTDGAKTKEGDECSGQMTRVSIGTMRNGMVEILEDTVTVGGSGGEPCTWQRAVRASGAPATVVLRRPMVSLPLTSRTYLPLVTQAVGGQPIELTGLFRIDLDLDGRDEVLFSATSIPDSSATGGRLYSGAGVRRLKADGTVETLFFVQMKGPAQDFQYPPSVRILGVTDIDGDGKLEVVLQDVANEGVVEAVWRLNPSGLAKLGGTACGA